MNDAILIDTDVFSYWLKGDTRGRLYTPDASGKTLCLSFMSVAEIKRWALSRGWGVARRSSLAAALSRYVVVPFDEPMADAWAEIGDTGRGSGGRSTPATAGSPQRPCGTAWRSSRTTRGTTGRFPLSGSSRSTLTLAAADDADAAYPGRFFSIQSSCLSTPARLRLARASALRCATRNTASVARPAPTSSARVLRPSAPASPGA